MTKVIRNPFPIPDLSQEGTWKKPPPKYDKTWFTGISPFHRLYVHQTLTMARKNPLLHRNKVPKDSLDFALTRVYDHDNDTFVPKAFALLQAETLNRKTWRLLRNEIKEPKEPKLALGHPIKHSDGRLPGDHKVDERQAKIDSMTGKKHEHSQIAKLRQKLIEEGRQRVHPSSVKLGVEGPHTDRTNPGFCRKIDGTFYGI